MHELASEIRSNLGRLAAEYDLRLRDLPGYDNMPPEDRLEAAQNVLLLTATGLESGDQAMFSQFVQAVTAERVAQGFEISSVQQATQALVEIIEPMLTTVEAANFLWRMLVQANAMLAEAGAEKMRIAEEALRASEERFRQLIEESSDVFFMTNVDGFCTYVNPRGPVITGYEPEELIGIHFTDLVPDEWKEQVAVFYLKQVQSRTDETVFEFPFKTKDGAIKWGEQTAQLLTDGDQVNGFRCSVRDISERREAEEALRESEERFRLVVENAQAGILIVDSAYRFTYANDELGRILGYSPEELVGMDFRSVLDEESLQAVADRYIRRQRGEEVPPRYELTVVRKDGEKRRLEMSAAVVKDSAGNVQTIGQVLDTTEQKEMEQAIQESLARRTQEVQLSTELAQEIAGMPALDELYQRVVTLIKERFGYYHAQIFHHDPNLDTMALVEGYGQIGERMKAAGHSLPHGQGVVGTAAASGKPVLAADITQDPNWVPHSELPETRGELAVPIILRRRVQNGVPSDEVLGVLDVQSDRAGAFTEEDQVLLLGLAGQIAAAVQSTRLLQEVQRHSEEAALVSRVVSAVASAEDRYSALDVLATELASAFSLGHVGIAMLDEGRTAVTVVADQPVAPDGSSGIGITFPLEGNLLTQQVMDTKQSVIVPDAQTNPVSAPIHEVMRQRDTQTLMISPLMAGDDVIGTVGFDILEKDRDFTPDQVHTIETVLAQAYAAIATVHLYDQARQEIAERERAEAALAQEQYLMNALMDTLPDGIHYKDAKGRFIRVNRAQAARFGLSDPVEAIGKTDFDFFTEEHARSAYESEQEIIRTGQPQVDYEEKEIWPDGPDTWVSTSKFPLYDVGGSIIGTFGISRDITARKQAETALAEERYLLRTLIDSLPDDIYVKDTQSRFLINNLSSLHTLGATTQEEVVGKTNLDFFSEELASHYYADERAIVESGQPLHDREEPVVQPDGTEVWFLTSRVPMFDSQGNVTGLVGIGRDITERKRTEAILERRSAQLETSAEVSQAASRILDPDELIQQVVELIRERFNLYYVGLFMVDQSGDWAREHTGRLEPGRWIVLRAGTGDAGQQMLAQGHRLEVGGESMIGWCVANSQARITLDIGDEAVHFDNPLLPDTRSELALPLTVRGETIGALTVQSIEPAAFVEEDITVLQLMANQVAIAIDNARLFEQSQNALQELEAAQRRYLRQAWSEYGAEEASINGFFQSRERQLPSAETWLPTVSTALQQMDTVVEDNEADGDRLVIPISLYGEVIGAIGFRREDMEHWRESDVAAAEAIVEQMALALDSQRLFDEAQQASFQMGQRVKELDSLNDIGRKMEETPPVPEFLQWVAERIPPAMQHPELCVAAVELEGEVFGSPGAIDSPKQIVQSLLVGRQRVGRVYIAYTEDLDFANEESALLGDITRRVGGYIESQRLLEETQVRAERLAVINRIASTVGATFDLDELMEIVYGEIANSFLAEAVFIALYHEATEELEFVYAVEDGVRVASQRHPLSGFSSIVIGQKRLLNIRNYQQEKDQLPVPVMVGGTKIHDSWLGVPMMVGDQVIGTISVMVDRPYAYGEEEELLLTTIADQVAVALERTRLLEDTRTRAEELAVLNEMSRDMAAMLDIHSIVENLHNYSSRLMDLTSFFVALYNAQEDIVSFPLFIEHGERVELASRRGGKGLTEYIVRTRRPMLIEENVGERLEALGIDSIGQEALSWLGVPMAIGERVIGVIAVQSYVTPRLYGEHHRDLLVAIASQAAIAIENARLLEQTQARAERERMVRTITDRVRQGADAEAIMRIGLEGLSQVLGTPDLVVRLGTRDLLQSANVVKVTVDTAQNELEKIENS